jgi:hypothetical protein
VCLLRSDGQLGRQQTLSCMVLCRFAFKRRLFSLHDGSAIPFSSAKSFFCSRVSLPAWSVMLYPEPSISACDRWVIVHKVNSHAALIRFGRHGSVRNVRA